MTPSALIPRLIVTKKERSVISINNIGRSYENSELKPNANSPDHKVNTPSYEIQEIHSHEKVKYNVQSLNSWDGMDAIKESFER